MTDSAKKNVSFQPSRSITVKLGIGLILLVCFMAVVSATGYFSIRSIRKANESINVSNQIQRLVLEMDQRMENARHLHSQFFIQYPRIGLENAHEQFAQPSIRQTAKVVNLSKELQEIIANAEVSDELRRSKVDLNLYLSSAKRFADTSIEAVQLVTILATPEKGLEDQLDRRFTLLREELGEEKTFSDLIYKMELFVRNHRVARERFLMQSSFNVSFALRKALESSPSIPLPARERVYELLSQMKELSEQILETDVLIKSKFADFILQDNAARAISETLSKLAQDEVEKSQNKISAANRLAETTLYYVSFVGLLAACATAWILHIIITRRIVSLTRSAEKLQEGRLDVTFDDSARDELGQLGMTFNYMTVRIKDLVDNLEQKVEEQTQKYKESERKYRQLVEGTEDLITRVDRHGNFTFVNKACEKIFGLTARQCIGRPSFHFIHKEDREKAQKDLADCLRQKKDKAVLENRQVSSDGEIHSMVWSVNFTYDTDGNVMYVDSIGRDITQLRKTEHSLQQEKKKAQKYLDVAGVMLTALDSSGNIILINQKGCELLHTTEQEALGQNWFDNYIPERLQQKIRSVFNKLMAGDLQPVEYYENAVLNSTGEERMIAFHNSLLKDGDGNIEGVLFSGEDITEKIQHDEARSRLESQLRQAHKMEAIGTLAGGIAHDFNNILSAILGYTEIATLDIPKNSTARKHLDEVLKAGNRAKELVQHILSFSRKEAQKRVPVKINFIVYEALKFLRATIPTNIEIQEDIDTGNGNILGNSTQIQQVIVNLCTNAAHAMEGSGGVLKVSSSIEQLAKSDLKNEPGLSPGKYVMITVKDNGPGIDPQIIDRIFDPYFTTKEVGKGSGMGLAIVVGIIKSHDGMITVQSEPGQGTSFNVFFPVIESKVEKFIDDTTSLPAGDERILIIDDEPSIAALNQQRLAKLGYETRAMTSSRESLKLFRADPHAFDIVITDQTMPTMTGDQLAKEMLQIRPDIPIILCTGYSSKIDAVNAIEAGISAFILKPVENKELAMTVRRVLDENMD